MARPSPDEPDVEFRGWLSRNVLAVLGLEFLWGVAAAISSLTAVITGYVESLGYPRIIIGLVPALFWGSYSVLQPFAVHLIRPGPTYLRKVVAGYVAGALSHFLMGIIALWSAPSLHVRLSLIIAALVGFILLVGLSDPHYMLVLFRTVPMHRRGRFFGIRSLAFGVGGGIGSLALFPILDHIPSPKSFAVAFMISGCVYGLAALCLTFYRDRDLVVPAPAPAAIAPHLKRLAARVIHHRPLLAFLVADLFFLIGFGGGYPLFAVHIRKILGADERIFAHLTLAYVLATCLFGLALGWLTDRGGYRRTMIAVVLLFGAGSAVLLWEGGPFWLYCAAYFVASVWMPGLFVTHFNLAQACAGDLTPAETAAVLNVTFLPIRLGGPLFVGLLFDFGWPTAAVGLTVIVSLISATILALGLNEASLRPKDS